MGPESAPGAAPAVGDARRELRDAPPFLSWLAIYVVVVGALAVEILLGVLVTHLFR